MHRNHAASCLATKTASRNAYANPIGDGLLSYPRLRDEGIHVEQVLAESTDIDARPLRFRIVVKHFHDFGDGTEKVITGCPWHGRANSGMTTMIVRHLRKRGHAKHHTHRNHTENCSLHEKPRGKIHRFMVRRREPTAASTTAIKP